MGNKWDMVQLSMHATITTSTSPMHAQAPWVQQHSIDLWRFGDSSCNMVQDMKPMSCKTSHLQLKQPQQYTLSHCQCRQTHHTWMCGQDRIDSIHVMSSRAYSTVLYKYMLLCNTTLHGHTGTWHLCENCACQLQPSVSKIKSVSKHKAHTDICTRDGMPNHAYSVFIVKHAYYP